MKTADIIAAIEKHNGNLTAAAQHLKCARLTLYRRAEKDVAIKRALDQARESMLDAAEHVLHRKVLQGSTAELIFFLKTQGRGRGYIERQEHDVSITDKRPESMSDSELEEFIADLKAHVR